MRKVLVSRMQLNPERDTKPRAPMLTLQLVGEALFHQFGSGYEEFESGPANFSTAIVEWPDGSVENVPVEHVKFLAPPQAVAEQS